ncbi:replication initiation protein [Thiospirillum jenense]|uniref:Replication initiation protein n=1 Tax=Thiospirillum jenense TaxID=1653858 RepID=A0A839HB07_9GAMM|nr:replication initiation protein [Thiospirillum jenense]MBB1125931.1 replication initiation protein [Thiospirillum jenense]
MTDKPEIVTKSNALVSATYRLTVAEQRILLGCIAQVTPREPITDAVMYKVTAAHIAALAETDRNSIHEELKEAALRLSRREIWITQLPNGGGKHKRTLVTRWVQTVAYEEGGDIYLRFSKDILPYISELQKEFTRYALADISKFDSAYSIRLYELMMQYLSKGEREIDVEELRHILILDDKYPAIADLKKWIIDPAIKDINAQTPIHVAYEQIKAGRRIVAFKFLIRSKVKAKQPAAHTAPPATPPAKPTLTRAYIEKHARPGESWAAATERLQRLLSTSV